MLRSLTWFFFFIIFSFNLGAQYNFPEPGYVFDDESVPRIDVIIPQDSLEYILALENSDSEHEFKSNFFFTRNNITDTIENVGFRLRGNTSRTSKKKSFKISINAFESGKKYHGLEKLNLNGEHNDPSILRSKMCWDLYRRVGIPSSRANHVELYINNQYYGLYINVEHIDEEFVQKRFSNKSGNLFKCLWPADLVYKGSNQSNYKDESNGRRTYDLKTNNESDDYSQLVQFIDILNNTTGDQFQCELEEIFDVDNYIKAIAMDILVSNWDGPIVNKNNFYLYHNPSTGKFTYIPFDLDNTFGIGWGSTDWTETDICEWSDTWGNVDRPLYENILKIKEYKDKLSYYLYEYLLEFFNNVYLDSYLEGFKTKLTPFRINDLFAQMDYGWDINHFNKSFDEGVGSHVRYGIRSYIEARGASIWPQLIVNTPMPMLNFYNAELKTDSIIFNINLFFPWEAARDVTLNYQYNDDPWKEKIISPKEESTYQTSLENIHSGFLNYYFEVSSIAGKRYWPFCNANQIILDAAISSDIVINELMASNSTFKTDETGAFEDWIELFNTSDTNINLGAYYITDDESNPGKWQLPEIQLGPEEYYTIWADNDESQGINHANFKLSKNGEFIGLYFKENNQFVQINGFTFPEQNDNKTYGRLPNGTGDLQVLPYPTFGYNNESPSSIEENNNSLMLSIFPNPSSEILNIENRELNISSIAIFDLYGNKVFDHSFSEHSQQIILKLNEIHGVTGQYILKARMSDNTYCFAKYIFQY